MSDPYLGEIRATGYNFAPRDWALCNGQTLPISQWTALYSILGTYYGGDGKTVFGLPNLQGACPVQFGQGAGLSYIELGQPGGVPAVTLNTQQMAAHPHGIGVVTGTGSQDSPSLASLSGAREGRVGVPLYGTDGPPPTKQVQMNARMLAMAGSSQPHNNMPPYLVVNFIIALQGIYPQRS
ncbi:MAG TPA: tail fiber protein [Streptosporangiaceae bacterium]|jgi:microcystin-dependent protein